MDLRPTRRQKKTPRRTALKHAHIGSVFLLKIMLSFHFCIEGPESPYNVGILPPRFFLK